MAVYEQLRELIVAGELPARVSESELAVRLRRTRAGHLARLREGLAEGTNLLYVPELFTRHHGVRATQLVAEALGEELGF